VQTFKLFSSFFFCVLGAHKFKRLKETHPKPIEKQEKKGTPMISSLTFTRSSFSSPSSVFSFVAQHLAVLCMGAWCLSNYGKTNSCRRDIEILKEEVARKEKEARENEEERLKTSRELKKSVTLLKDAEAKRRNEDAKRRNEDAKREHRFGILEEEGERTKKKLDDLVRKKREEEEENERVENERFRDAFVDRLRREGWIDAAENGHLRPFLTELRTLRPLELEAFEIGNDVPSVEKFYKKAQSKLHPDKCTHLTRVEQIQAEELLKQLHNCYEAWEDKGKPGFKTQLQ